MNFAFVTILLLFITLPGISIRRSYYASRFSLNYISTNLLNELMWSIIPAIFIHGIAILIIENNFDILIKLDCFGYLVAGGDDKVEIHKIFDNIHSNIDSILVYNVILIFVAILIGNLARLFVRGIGLDILFRVFRFPNRWHYFFTGEYLSFGKGLFGIKFHKKIDFIVVDVLVSVGNENVIYSGKLEDYYLSKTGNGLDRIVIKYPTKKEFTFDSSSEEKEIPGDYLSIPYDKISNINTQYYIFGNDI